jgi:hypothetical protein
VFTFEAHEVEWLVGALLDEPFHRLFDEAIDQWRPLVDGPPRIAREAFSWQRRAAERVN